MRPQSAFTDNGHIRNTPQAMPGGPGAPARPHAVVPRRVRLPADAANATARRPRPVSRTTPREVFARLRKYWAALMRIVAGLASYR